jgi:probable phosphoglycerate mutase
VTDAAPRGPLIVHIDGGSRGNPGDAAFGVHVADSEGKRVAELYGFLGRATNNVAEYEALLHALQWAAARGEKRLQVFSDSELLVRQLEGRYKVKHPDLRPLYERARILMTRFAEVKVAHVRREQNVEADALVNRALDERASKLS